MHNAVFGEGAYRLWAHPASALQGQDADLADVADVADVAGAVEDTADTDVLWRRICQSLGGCNVTSPFKERLFPYVADVADETCARVGACNTILFTDDGVPRLASNTDVEGLLTAWRRAALFVSGRPLAIVGTGGAARATMVAAVEAGATRVTAYGRDAVGLDRLHTLGVALGMPTDTVVVDVETLVGDRRDSAGREAPGVVVFAVTSLDDPATWLQVSSSSTSAIHDLRYGRAAWPLRNAALSLGRTFLDGTSMLLAQAEAAAMHFADRPLALEERDAMRRALVSHLQRQATVQGTVPDR